MSQFTDEAKNVISAVAPGLGTILGGPLGGLAGGLLAKAFGAKDANGNVVPADPKAIEKLILGQDPETLLKLKQVDADLQVKLRELEIDESKLNFDDRDSARKREMAVRDDTPRNLAYIYTLGFFSMMAAQLHIVINHVPIDPVGMRMLDTTTGVLFAMMLGSKEYYFGSSSSSKFKDETISKLSS